MRARSHLKHLRQMSNFFQVRDTSGVDNRCANVIDELFLYELVAVKNRIENLADSQWSCGVAANQAKAFLQFRRE